MPTTPLRRTLASLALLVLSAAGAFAQGRSVAESLQAVRRAYTTRDIAQRVDFAFSEPDARRTETLLVRTGPPGSLRLVLGPLTIWTEGDALYAVHADDGRAYFSAPLDERGPLGALDNHFPRVPLPQLRFAFGPDNALLNPTPYTRDMVWSAAEEHGAEGAIRLVGAGENCTAELFAAPDGVLTGFTIQLGARSIDISAAPAAASDFPAVTPGLDRRFRIDSPRDFVRRGGLVLVGDALPALPLRPRLNPGPKPTLGPPGAILFFRQWTRETATALSALRLAAESIDGFQYTAVMVFHPIEGAVEFQLNEGASETDPDPLFYTDDPDATVRRFSDASSVLVVIGPDNTVRAITDLAPILGRDAKEQGIFELHAKPDEAAERGLVEEIRGAVGAE